MVKAHVRDIASVQERAASFDDEYRQLWEPMVRVAYLIVRSRAVAEELAQEAFLQLHRHYDTVENAGGFVRTTLVRLCLNWLRRSSLEWERIQRIPDLPPLGEPELDTTWDALARLRPERRAVLVLRYYEDLSHREIARVMRCPITTVRTRVRRGLADLKEELKR